MEAQHNLSKVLRSIGPKERVAITRNKKIVAEITLTDESQTPDFPDFRARAATTWRNGWKGSSSSELLNETRGER